MRSRSRVATAAGFAVCALAAALLSAVTPARSATLAADSPSVVDALPSLGTAGGVGDSTSDPGTAASDSSSIDTVVSDPSLCRRLRVGDGGSGHRHGERDSGRLAMHYPVEPTLRRLGLCHG